MTDSFCAESHRERMEQRHLEELLVFVRQHDTVESCRPCLNPGATCSQSWMCTVLSHLILLTTSQVNFINCEASRSNTA